MGKSVVIDQEQLMRIRESVIDDSHGMDNHVLKEASAEVDEYEIGAESDNPPMGGNAYHINESYSLSIRGDVDTINSIMFVPHDNADEECDDEEEKEDFEPFYEIEGINMEGDTIMTGDICLSELNDYFPQSVVNDIIEKNGRPSSHGWRTEYRIDDILYRDTAPNDINDADEVNAIAKRIQTGGPSGFILTDGETIYFHDHYYINNIDGMTISKFLGLGNIRIGEGGSIELIRKPTIEQISALKQYSRMNNGYLYLDIAEESNGFYPSNICSAKYNNANPNRLINDILSYFDDGIRPQGNNFYEGKSSINLSENLESEVEASEVDLSSFKKKHELAPNIWKPNGELNSRVRLKLLGIADDFWKFVNLTWVKPNGIILTGSICNFNWSHYSDIDLHLIVDFDEIDEKTDFVRDYLDSKKNDWNNQHEGLEIMGYKVELYVQDEGEMPQSNGIYDLEENVWIKEPNPNDIKSISLNKFSIKKTAAKIMTIIDDMYDKLVSTDDSHEIDEIGEDANYLWKKVKDMRKKSLEEKGESGEGNIIYKVLRRTDYLDRLFKLLNVVYDKANSINENVLGEALNNSQNPTVIDLAIQEFGITSNIYQCGYILPNGAFLNLGYNGIRDIDHRGIKLIYDKNNIPIWDDTYQYNYVVDFMNHGAIRCDVNYGLLDMTREPSQKQYAALKRFVRIAQDVDIDFTDERGNTEHSVSYSNVKPLKVVADIEKYYNEGIKPYGNVSESVIRPSLLKEYLDKDHNYPLYQYFKWAKEASDEDKARDVAYQCPWLLERAIEELAYGDEEYETLLDENGDFDKDDDDNIERLIEMLAEKGQCGDFNAKMENIASILGLFDELPTWITCDFRRIVKNEWCIHFTEDAYNIARYGFTGGTPDLDSLAYTNAGQKKYSEGYDFAFSLGEHDIDYNNYGSEAVLFQTNGVEIYHYGDGQNQVIFWGPSAKNFIPIVKNGSYYAEGDWAVYGSNDQVLKSGTPSEIIEWAVDNLPQYRKQIMFGKNGYIPKNKHYDIEQHRWIEEPYPPYRNENVRKYLTVLKEEVVADGNSEHNPYKKRWDAERKALKDFICNYGKVMTSKENGKTYKVYYDKTLSQLIGYNYCICLQWDMVELKPKSVLYIRALDKFTNRIFQASYDTRGRDNQIGTNDDIGQ